MLHCGADSLSWVVINLEDSKMSAHRFTSSGFVSHSRSIFPGRSRCPSFRPTARRRVDRAVSCSTPAASDQGVMTCVSEEPETRTRFEEGRRFRPFIRSLLQRNGPLHTFLSRWLLSCRGPPMLATAATLVLPQMNGNGIGELLSRNYVFKAGFCAWLLAQTAKIFTRRFKQGRWDIRAIVDSGGMPSSHSALCTAVTTAVGLEFGLASSLFAVSLCFTLITMYDATGVRYHSGKQAEVLNILVEDVMQGHPVSEQRLKEVLGHNPLEVIAGSILGVVIGMLTPVPPAIVL